MMQFNVMIYDFNHKKIEPYNIIPYFINEYKEQQKYAKKYKDDEYYKVPVTFDEFKKFIEDKSIYRFWSRCEYEFIVSSWPPSKNHEEEKIDIHKQIIMNINIITKIVMNEIKNGTV